MMKIAFTIVLLFFLSSQVFGSSGKKTLRAKYVKTSDTTTLKNLPADFFNGVTATVTKDISSGEKITLKAAYSDTYYFMKVEFDRAKMTDTHKRYTWNNENKFYISDSNDIEDHFVIRWIFDDYPNASLLPREHKADVWFWKANRTNPVGYADDKMHVIQLRRTDKKKFKKLSSTDSSGRSLLYLGRLSDEGRSSYEETKKFTTYTTEKIARYKNRLPQGSRSDVQAFGFWENGKWTVLLKRKLDTKHPDDISFLTKRSYFFGISLFEIADKPLKRCKHYYGCGKISETLKLVFEKKN